MKDCYEVRIDLTYCVDRTVYPKQLEIDFENGGVKLKSLPVWKASNPLIN